MFGISGIGTTELLLILGVVILIFGTKRLKTLGSDLGTAFRGFKNAMNDKDPVEPAASPPKPLITAEDSQQPPATDSAAQKAESSKKA